MELYCPWNACKTVHMKTMSSSWNICFILLIEQTLIHMLADKVKKEKVDKMRVYKSSNLFSYI